MRSISNVILALFCIVLMGTVSPAQSEASRQVSSVSDRSTVNEDQGQAYIITSQKPTSLRVSKGRTPVLPQQISIFLGDEWNSNEFRSMQPALANLFESPAALLELRAAGLKGPESNGPFIQVSYEGQGAAITDLAVQEQIRTAVINNAVPAGSGASIVVVFLSPSIHSKLAEKESGKHFLAYKNILNVNSTRTPYVVVPLEANPQNVDLIARKAFIAAALGQ
jgi:hypothetical protein